MNLQQLRYVVATADEGTMTQAAASLHVAQPALSRAVRALEAEIDLAVFERDGRGVRVTRQGREVVALARRVLADVDRIASVGASTALRVSAITAQAREIASAAVARFVAGGGGRLSLDVVDTPDEVVDSVRDGRARLGVMELPAPPGLRAASLGWQEIVLLHPPDWTLPDPFELSHLPEIALLAPEATDWRRDRMVRTLRAAGIEPNITAETNDRGLMLSLVQQGAGAWFSYGREAAAAVAGGAGLVHLSPAPFREIGVVSAGDLDGAAAAFLEALRAEADGLLIPVGDPRLADGTWVTDAVMQGAVPATTDPRGVPPPPP
jgi:LysR family transcriptional regulator, cyn operon transcriptional activator